MKQVVLNLKDGDLTVEEVPIPTIKGSGVLVRNHYSVISAGTESGVVDLADKSLIGKARARPDLAMKVINKAKQDGPISAFQQAMGRLEKREPLGYSSAGTVISVSEDIKDIKPGDRVACAGAGYANHADVVFVPRNLCAKVPENVDFKNACFTTVGSIAMQGVRNADVKIGENIVVIGLGLIGLITLQILKASGCRVFGVDLDESKVNLARELGADLSYSRNSPNLEERIKQFSRGIGADSTIITAATRSNDPVDFAGKITRERGKVVIVGLVGMDIPREEYYNKELEMRISRSYGPGRYDRNYEEYGQDYPAPYVRWTENRNMQAFLDLISMKKISMEPIITHEYEIEQAPEAYNIIKERKPYLGLVLKYDTDKRIEDKVILKSPGPVSAISESFSPVLGVIGAGIFATSILLPNLSKIKGVKLKGLSAASGLSCESVAKKYGFEYCTSDYHKILSDPEINCVSIVTRNSLHASLVIEALKNKKNVLVEKPLALNEEELNAIIEAKKENGGFIMVGFNRRYSELGVKLKDFFKNRSQSMVAYYRVNAESIPKDHWVYDESEGGSRIITECCHFIDFMQFIIGSSPVEVYARKIESQVKTPEDNENVSITIAFEDGSIGTLIYTTHGDSSVSKEHAEFFADGMVGAITDFKQLKLVKDGKCTQINKRLITEKGHKNELENFFKMVKQGPSKYSFEENVLTTVSTLKAAEHVMSGGPVKLI
ncbi:bi-domain-containing oxidoreductase [Methanosarcina mazei]|uniref:Oxidoreductase n=4 Tax=Methanosarcina mazei TaxID=2209 RepID=A0A0F8LZB8_METMZ|nr:bi-domain-containing oxidoreductase [Methanosarcina mazei]AAM32748.1 oxidoreductase [Methanosarcina mazei Go1]AKB64832.1 Sorbitol dehydrogenase [Methanosarcina mazei S-6]KKH13697.1 oxidoreductase [Methanosarcina mazei]KKH16754.1 oxidoreductase [Methanosarcina mazei]KKH21600.1 oxidoreductase [Methanosarcina mazei]